MDTNNRSIPYLSYEDLAGLGITAIEVVDTLEHVIRGSTHAPASVWGAPKAVITPPDGRYIMATLAAMDDPSLVVTKSLVLNERNIERGLPQINSLVSVLDGETGVPIALMDGNWVTAIRTAGLSATAAKYMANEDAVSIGFVGCGVQAKSHLLTYSELFPLQRIKLFGRGRTNIDGMCEMAHALDLTAEVCASARDAVSGVDLVVTSATHTGVSDPFLDANWLSPGCFATIVDLAVPWHKDSFAVLDVLVIDDLVQEAALPNKLADPVCVSGDLSGLITQGFKGRCKASDRTAFAFRGHALGDLAVSALAYRKHNERNH